MAFVDEVEGETRFWFDPRQGWQELMSRLDNWINPRENIRRYEQTYHRLKAELERRPTWDDLPEPLQEAFPVLGRIREALPLDAARRLVEAQQDAVTRLRALVETDFRSKEVRPAMGWAGLREAVDIDRFTREMVAAGRFIEVNQTPWLKSHSGMQEPQGKLGEMLRQRSYHDAIIAPMLKTTGFGRYPMGE